MNRILILLDHNANRSLLARTLEPDYEVVLPTDRQIPDEPIDLVIVDDRAMARLRKPLEARRKAEEPFFLPVIYVTSRLGMKLLNPQVWRVVDDLLITPADKNELFTRIRLHLRARNYSLDLKRQNEELRQLDTMKDQFLSIISHELRTPINAIMGFGSVLDDEIVGALNAEQHLYLQKMLTGSDHLLSLVDELLDLSRIQAGQLMLERGPVDLRELIEQSIAGILPLAEKKRLRLISHIPDGLPTARVDGRRVNQVLINLINNAIKFTPDEGTITVRARLADHGLLVEVEDTGIGISVPDMARLFQRFNQVDTSYIRKSGGVGLGLAISKGLVEAHGGTIGVRSEPGRGSTFWFTLPIPREQSVVRLVKDLPEHGLKAGTLGTITTVHDTPALVYEVAFSSPKSLDAAATSLALAPDWIEPIAVPQ
ncbi:MAG: ATP-binding protein [Candidatus Sericytochromatia bacterium]